MCKSVYDYQKENLCISATLKSCVLALDKASASQVLATKHLQISPHLPIFASLPHLSTSLRIFPSSHRRHISPHLSASLHISPHLSTTLRISASSHLRIFASLQITFAYPAAEQNIKAKSPPQTQTRQQYDEEETNY